MPANRIDDAVAQLRRTAAWLQSAPLAKLAARERHIPHATHDLVCRLDALTREVARETAHLEECPPAQARPHEVADAAVGAQLAVFTDQFDRVRTGGDAAVSTASVEELHRLGQVASALRRG